MKLGVAAACIEGSRVEPLQQGAGIGRIIQIEVGERYVHAADHVEPGFGRLHQAAGAGKGRGGRAGGQIPGLGERIFEYS